MTEPSPMDSAPLTAHILAAYHNPFKRQSDASGPLKPSPSSLESVPVMRLPPVMDAGRAAHVNCVPVPVSRGRPDVRPLTTLVPAAKLVVVSMEKDGSRPASLLETLPCGEQSHSITQGSSKNALTHALDSGGCLQPLDRFLPRDVISDALSLWTPPPRWPSSQNQDSAESSVLSSPTVSLPFATATASGPSRPYPESKGPEYHPSGHRRHSTVRESDEWPWSSHAVHHRAVTPARPGPWAQLAHDDAGLAWHPSQHSTAPWELHRGRQRLVDENPQDEAESEQELHSRANQWSLFSRAQQPSWSLKSIRLDPASIPMPDRFGEGHAHPVRSLGSSSSHHDAMAPSWTQSTNQDKRTQAGKRTSQARTGSSSSSTCSSSCASGQSEQGRQQNPHITQLFAWPRDGKSTPTTLQPVTPPPTTPRRLRKGEHKVSPKRESSSLAQSQPGSAAITISSSAAQPVKKESLYKTEMCRSFEETGQCKYGERCHFAHFARQDEQCCLLRLTCNNPYSELRQVKRHPLYKTEICKTFWNSGTCPYGKRCCFIHSEKQPGSGSTQESTQQPMASGGARSRTRSRLEALFQSERAEADASAHGHQARSDGESVDEKSSSLDGESIEGKVGAHELPAYDSDSDVPNQSNAQPSPSEGEQQMQQTVDMTGSSPVPERRRDSSQDAHLIKTDDDVGTADGPEPNAIAAASNYVSLLLAADHSAA